MKKVTIEFIDGTVNFEMKQNALNHLQSSGYRVANVKWSNWNGLCNEDVQFEIEDKAIAETQDYLSEEMGVQLEFA